MNVFRYMYIPVLYVGFKMTPWAGHVSGGPTYMCMYMYMYGGLVVEMAVALWLGVEYY